MMGLANVTNEVVFGHPSIATLIILAVVIITAKQFSNRRKGSLPPGPRGIPLIGNIFKLDEQAWLTLTEWKKTYGPIMHVNMGGLRMIVLGNSRVAEDILSRDAAKTSGRLGLTVVDIMTGGMFFATMGPTARWRKYRKALGSWTRKGPDNSYRVRPAMYKEATILTEKLLDCPDVWQDLAQLSAVSTIMGMVYGEVPGNTPAEEKMNGSKLRETVQRLTKKAGPWSSMMDVFPLLKLVPTRFSPWKMKAEQSFSQNTKLVKEWLDVTRNHLERGTTQHSIGRTILEDSDLSQTERDWLAFTAVAGAMTLTGSLGWFFMAMALHPDAQVTAQKELDRVVGTQRTPKFEDIDQLPYVQALVKEVHRWRPVAPLGLPHANTEDIWYGDYFIPKDSLLVANTWAMGLDKEEWGEDADHFNPSRYTDSETGGLKQQSALSGKGRDRTVFGFGRRVCPGQHLADDFLFMFAAMILWAVKIEPRKDEDGKQIPIDSDRCIDEGVAVRPRPFPCAITPRNTAAKVVLGTARERA